MLQLIDGFLSDSFVQQAFSGGIFCLVMTFLSILFLQDKLPRDGGKAFAVGGQASVGKATGAGILFVTVTILTTVLFVKPSVEIYSYMGIFFLEMLFGFLDDKSGLPWGRLKKGLLDLFCAAAGAGIFLYYNEDLSGFYWGSRFVSLPTPVYLFLAVLLILVAINVTNCSDGVDGLSGSLFLVTVLPFIVLMKDAPNHDMEVVIIFLMAAILGYLWFNTNPSIVLMGDAGSRVMGYAIALLAMKSGHVLMYIPFSLMLILDGGSSLFKITMIHLTGKKNFMSKTRTPLHDHARKNREWPAQQVTQRFLIMQIVVSFAVYALYVMTKS